MQISHRIQYQEMNEDGRRKVIESIYSVCLSVGQTADRFDFSADTVQEIANAFEADTTDKERLIKWLRTFPRFGYASPPATATTISNIANLVNVAASVSSEPTPSRTSYSKKSRNQSGWKLAQHQCLENDLILRHVLSFVNLLISLPQEAHPDYGKTQST